MLRKLFRLWIAKGPHSDWLCFGLPLFSQENCSSSLIWTLALNYRIAQRNLACADYDAPYQPWHTAFCILYTTAVWVFGCSFVHLHIIRSKSNIRVVNDHQLLFKIYSFDSICIDWLSWPVLTRKLYFLHENCTICCFANNITLALQYSPCITQISAYNHLILAAKL